MFLTVRTSYEETQHRALLFVTHASVNEKEIEESQEKQYKKGRVFRPYCRLGFLEADAGFVSIIIFYNLPN